MDEPLGALDKKLREEMQIEIKHIHENLGITMVFVTHDQGEALTMSDRIAVFNDGRIQQIDKPATLYERPANQFVANFIGETNMLPAIVETAGENSVTLRLEKGAKVSATPAEHLQQGAAAVLSVRPERLAISTETDSFNDLPAKLIETIYHGASAMMVFQLESGQQVTAQLGAGSPLLGMANGTGVRLSFAADDALAFAAAGSR